MPWHNEFPLELLVPTLLLEADDSLLLQPILMDGGNYIKEGRDSAKSTCLIFSPKQEAVGALAKSLKLFEVQYSIKLMT
jgi:phenylalanine-4-hydroxylase